MPPARIPQGEIYFRDHDILKMSNSELQQVRGRGISMIFQDPTSALNPVFNIGEQMKAVIKHSENRGKRSSHREIHQQAINSLREVALADPQRLPRSYPIQLSGGLR